MEGFQILRQHGFMYCRDSNDRNFVWSMFFSFSKTSPMILTAAGYFQIDRALLVAVSYSYLFDQFYKIFHDPNYIENRGVVNINISY